MRLIDADEFAIEEPKLWDWDSIDGISSTAVLKQCIWDVQCAPEVKAIPIEWILNYRFNNRGEITYYTIDAIDHMLSEWCEVSNIDMWDMINGWEKENEID